MKKRFISVVVPAFNSEKTVENCIKSLLCQKYPKNKYEVIVVDNISTDKTLMVLQKFGKKIKIFKEQKRGSYHARNTGVKNAVGEIVAFTDSDCTADRNWLLYISQSFKFRQVKLVGGRIRAQRTNKALLKYMDRFGHSQSLSCRSSIPYFATSNMAVRNKSSKNTTMFNEALRSGGDIEFCSRLIKNRREIYYEPKAIVRHFYNDPIIDFIKKQYYYGMWCTFLRKNFNIFCNVPLPRYTKIMKLYGFYFLFLRVLQDLSHKLGLYFGRFEYYGSTD